MKLVIKLYPDKQSRIGVLFENQFKASKSYESILDKHPKETFQVKIEVIKDKANLILKSDQSHSTVEYKGLEYKPEQLQKLQAFITPETPMQFVHVYGDYDNLFIAKPMRGRKMEFVLISRYSITTPDEFGDVM